VIQANQDIATSDALKMSMQLDKDGERTLGVITKIDLMDSGTDATKILNNDEIPLKYGYVGIKGRSQADIKNGMTIKRGLEEETKFFDTHPRYSNIHHRHKTLGTSALTNKLTNLLNINIQQNLPHIKDEIKEKLKECERNLGSIGTPLPKNPSERQSMVTGLFNKYVEGYKNTIDGKFNKLNRDTEPIGAQMRAAFERIFKETYEGKSSLTYYLTDDEIDRAFINFDGDAFPGSPSYDGFLSLLHPFIDKLYNPAYDLVEECYNNLENTSKQMISEVFKRFPALEEMVTGLTSGVLMKVSFYPLNFFN
jgi:replication fork clamp-binding protein CrfC